jgi:hypothetical protein
MLSSVMTLVDSSSTGLLPFGERWAQRLETFYSITCPFLTIYILINEVIAHLMHESFMKVCIMLFSNIDYENDTFITQFSEENKRLHH